MIGNRVAASIIAFGLASVAVAGCGGATRTVTKTATEPAPTTSTSATQVQQAAQCRSILRAQAAVERDAGQLAHNASDPTVDNSAVADIDGLVTAVQAIAPRVASSQQPILNQYVSALQKMETAIQSAASGNLVAAGGELTGVSREFQQLSPQVLSICSV